jgi:hypothetical protein
LLGLTIGLAFVAHVALAEEESIHLDFQVPAGCPGRDEFIAHVRARTERVRFVDGDATRVSDLHIQARFEGDRAIGRLRIGESQDAERLVSGKSCPDVMSALALIAAVAIDPTSVLDSAGPSETAAAPASELASPASGFASTSPPAPPESPEPPPPRASLSWFGGTGASGEVSRGFAPRAITLAGASLFAEAGLALGEAWRPAVRLAAVWSASPTVLPDQMPDSGAATFMLFAGRLSLCPLEFAPHASFRVRPCADFELGQLTGKGQPVDNGSVTTLRSGSMIRVAVGQTLQARVRLASRFWLEMAANVREPLVRQNFVFHEPEVTVASVPPVELAGALGLGAYFP